MATKLKSTKKQVTSMFEQYLNAYGVPEVMMGGLSALFHTRKEAEAYKKLKQREYNLKKKEEMNKGWYETKPTQSQKGNTIIRCPHCGVYGCIVKYGFQDYAFMPIIQRYRCKICGRTFTEHTLKTAGQDVEVEDTPSVAAPKQGLDKNGKPITKKKPVAVKQTKEQKEIARLIQSVHSLNNGIVEKDTKIDDLKKEITALKKEISHLKKTGIFPLEKKPESNGNAKDVTCRIDLLDLINTDFD